MKKELAILIAGIFVVSSLIAVAVKPENTGFEEVNGGYLNTHARVYHEWIDYPIVWLNAKWSKDFDWEDFLVPDPDEEDGDLGAWLLVNLEAYLDEEEELLEWPDGEVPEEALWKIIVTFKVMRVGNDPEMWEAYEDEDAIMVFPDFFYNNGGTADYDDDDVPMYIMFQAHLKIYEWDDGLGDWVLYDDYDFIGMPPYGLGQPLFVTVET